MSKEDFIRIINGFDIKNINEYWLRVKGSDDLNFELMQGFADIEKSLERLDDLEYRIDKAIEYIINEATYSACDEMDKLLDILRDDKK